MDDFGALFTQFLQVLTDFKSAGLFLGAVALVNLLVNVTKLKALDKFFADKKWARAALALMLPAAAGFLMALSQGKSSWDALMAALAGLGAGLGAMGMHETVQVAKSLPSS